jgi:N-acetylneuraminate synthase
MSYSFSIDGRNIGPGYPPYVIAEMSANHNGSISNAFRLIEVAKNAGADAVKMQSYLPSTITIDCDGDDFQIKGGLWDGLTLYKLYEKAHTPWEWHKPLFEHAKKLNITIFSSPFDHTAVDLLEDLNVPAYKIASFEAIDIPLIRYVAKTGKPMIISTGMASKVEIEEAIDAAYSGGCASLSLLHCVSGYPAPAREYNLRTIPDMISKYGLVVGLSDHTLDNTTALTSIALGASIVEKHFTLDRNGGGPDDSFSLEPAGLMELCNGCKTAWDALGSISYSRTESESGNMKFRRSLYFITDIKAGEIITPKNIKSIRPGMGIAPKYYDSIIGKQLQIDVKRGTPVSWDKISKK